MCMHILHIPSRLDVINVLTGELDRAKLGQIIFSDASQRRKLNAATHLPVYVELFRQVVVSWLMCKLLVIIDMPLLFETGSHKWLKPSVLVYTDQGTQASAYCRVQASCE